MVASPRFIIFCPIPDAQRQASFLTIPSFLFLCVTSYQCLYADTFMDEKEFRLMFNHALYDKMREKYDCEGAFPSIYQKIRPEAGVLEDEGDANEKTAV